MGHPNRFVGRAAELRVLGGLLDTTAAGHGGSVALIGEPGIGKTRLLAEMAARADARGMLVLTGSASEFERDLSFWVFVDALDEYLGGLPPGRLDGLDTDAHEQLGALFPALRSPGPRPQREDQRYRTHRAVRRCLEVLASRTPVILVLDDLHWADPGSVELLGALLRRPPSAAVLVALALRPRQMPDRLAAALQRARPLRMELGPLTAAEARELVGSPGRRGAELYAESGGNPFYLEQLARVDTPGRRTTLAPGAPGRVPNTVAAALADELALLDPGTRRVLEGAAVTGDPFVPELAAAAADLSEPTVTAALDELLRRDLVRPTTVPRRFRFRHPLVRRAVHDAAPGGWRLGAHERVAAALDARGASATVRAHHIAHSARVGDPDAIAVLRDAGETLLPRAPAGAARWLRAALQLLPDSAPDGDRLALGMALAGAEQTAGDLVSAHRTLLRCLELVPTDAVAERVRLAAACAGIEHVLGHHETAHRRLGAALDSLPDDAPAEAARLLLELARDGTHRLEFGALQDWSRRALAAARPLGDPALLARACVGLAFSAVFGGAIDDAREPYAEALALVDGLSDDRLGRCPDPLATHLARTELFLDRFEEAQRHADRGLAIARATGRDHLLPLLYWTGTVHTACGHLADAAAVLDDAVEIARLSGNPTMLAWNLLGRSATAVAAGDTDLALATAEESVEALHGTSRVLVAVWAALALATALDEAGIPDRAARTLLDGAGGVGLPLLPAPQRAAGFELLVRCGLATGRRTDAAAAAGRATEWADQIGLPTSRAAAERAAALLALDRDDPVTAAEQALRATDLTTGVGAVLAAAGSRQLAGRALAAAGEIARAADALQRAAADLDGYGAPRRRAAAERELRRLGHRRLHRRSAPGERDGVGLAALTGRELQIARLVADRRTNAQIAAELYLAPKTVETHIRNLFAKLDVSSRVEIARMVDRADRELR